MECIDEAVPVLLVPKLAVVLVGLWNKIKVYGSCRMTTVFYVGMCMMEHDWIRRK